MNNNFYVDSNLKKLLEMIYAPMYTKILFAAIELDVFSELKEEKTHIKVAKDLKLHVDNTRYLLDALVGMEMLEKEAGIYKNTSIASKYLERNSELYIGDHIRIYNMASGFEELDIVKLMKEGPKSDAANKEGLEAYKTFGDFTEMIKVLQRGGRAKEIADLVSSLPEFDNFSKMLDLGGGPGLLGMEVVKRHPDLNAVIFDAPDVGKVAEASIREYNLEDRVEVLTGDYLKDSIGEGYDFILAIGTLNFAKHDMDSIINKIYNALNPNGVFMCISEGLTHENTRPKEITVAWLPSFLKGFDFSLKQGEVSDSALRNGFKSVYKRTASMLTGEMDIDIARK